MNEMFWVSNYILQTCNKVLKFSCDICTHSLENVTIVSKKYAKAMKKNCNEKINLLDVLLLQEAPVGGDLLLQTALDVQESSIVSALLLNAPAHLTKLCLKCVDLFLETC